MRNDGLPGAICTFCHEKLLSSNLFRKQCMLTGVYLQDILTRHNECVLIKNEMSEDDSNTFQDYFETEYLLVITYLPANWWHS